MYRTTGHIFTTAAILIIVCLSNVTFAAPISFHDFYTSPYFNPTVTVHDDSSATIEEDLYSASVLLSNQPSLGDPDVIIPGANTILSFDYIFTVKSENMDEFRVNLYDSETYPDDILDDFFIFDHNTDLDGEDNIFSGTVSFDISNYVGTTLGLDFELRSSDDPIPISQDSPLLDSTVILSNLRLEIASNVPEFSTTFLLLFGSLLCLGITRRLM